VEEQRRREEAEIRTVDLTKLGGDEIKLILAPGIEMIMMRVPAGEFLYGLTRWKVHLDEYWIGKYPVTNAQFRAYLQATRYDY